MTDGDNDFFEQCLNVCILQKEKFLPFVTYIEDLIKNDVFQFFDTNGFYEFIMSRILELKLVEHLKLLLDYFALSNRSLVRVHDEKHLFFKKNLINSKFLLLACVQDSLDLVKVFVKHKWLLTITADFDEGLNWNLLLIPMVSKIVPPNHDKVLQIFKMMATKAYMLGCYQAMIETKGMHDCQCEINVMTNPTGFKQALWQSLSKIKPIEGCHDCPAADNFVPNFMDCEDHVECNDPISR